MPTSRENILQAVPAAGVLRGAILPERIPTGGLLILRDGDPGTPEVTLSPPQFHFEHRAEVKLIVQGADSDAIFDALTASMAAAISVDRTLGGLCDWLAQPVDLPVEGAEGLKAAIVPINLTYTTTDPFG
jgi:hypothetical protein